jgi:hypothetical protein
VVGLGGLGYKAKKNPASSMADVQRLCIAFDDVRDLMGYKILRNKMTRKNSILHCPFPVSLCWPSAASASSSFLFSPPLRVSLFELNQVEAVECKFRTETRE